VERGSDKHGRLLDEALAHETESIVRSGREARIEEWRSAEPAGEDEPDTQTDHVALPGGTPAGMSPSDVEGRAELAQYLNRSPFPAVREQLIGAAIDRHAPDRIVDQLRALPSGRVFENVAEVWCALGGHVEGERF
jgi:hypothetical protein